MALSFPRLLFWSSLLRRTPDPRPHVADPPEGPAAPSDLVATAVSSTQVDLTWTDNSNNETGFSIRRGLGTGPGPTSPVGGIRPADSTSFTDAFLDPNTTYFYTIHAINDFGASGIDGPASTTTLSPPTALTPDYYSPPSGLVEGQSYGLRARVLNSDGSIHTNYVPSDWNWTITAGGSFGSIGGANGDVLTLNAGTADNMLTVQASYVGAETLDPTTDSTLHSINAESPGGLNEPGGMTVSMAYAGTADSPGQAFSTPGWTQWFNTPSGASRTVVADATNPTGSGQSLRFQWAAGSPASNAGCGKATLNNFPGGPWKELYVRLRIFWESGWNQNHKIFYIRAPENSTFVNYVSREGTASNAPLRGMTAPGGNLYQSNKAPAWTNISDFSRFPLQVGSWKTIEWHLRVESIQGSTTDGFMRAWVDGVKCMEVLNVTHNKSAWDDMHWYATANSVAEVGHYRVGELYISGKN